MSDEQEINNNIESGEGESPPEETVTTGETKESAAVIEEETVVKEGEQVVNIETVTESPEGCGEAVAETKDENPSETDGTNAEETVPKEDKPEEKTENELSLEVSEKETIIGNKGNGVEKTEKSGELGQFCCMC